MKFSELVLSRVGILLAAVLTGTRGLGDVRIIVPSAVPRGDDVTLHCLYDLEGDQQYVVKWYFNTTEFYQYYAYEYPTSTMLSFTQRGLSVRETDSNDTSVVLEHVPRILSGRYSCEVSSDALMGSSRFHTTRIGDADLQVVDLPKKGPDVNIDRKRYEYGDILKATCTSEHSNPAANLTWYVNGLPAETQHVNNSREISTDGQYYTAHSLLRVKITKQLSSRDNLKIRCVAKMYDIYYRSKEITVERTITTTADPVQLRLTDEPSTTVRRKDDKRSRSTDNSKILPLGFLNQKVYDASSSSRLFSMPTLAIVSTIISLVLQR